MYHPYFGLREEPFGVSPDSRFFYQTPQHAEALATLYYGIQQRRGFALLVGQAGLGKTSILVQLMQLLQDRAETAWLPHPCFDRSNILESILLALGLPKADSQAQRSRVFYEYLMKLRLEGKTCVVIFDEAQDLNRDTLESIRMLSNFETASGKLVEIVLAGQPPLATTLARPECEQLRQRINVVARLQPLGPRDVHDYITHRLVAAGLPVHDPENASEDLAGKVFAPESIVAIADASRGVPRNINTICFNSLTIAFALNRSRAGYEEVREALRDLDLRDLGMSVADLLQAPDLQDPGTARHDLSRAPIFARQAASPHVPGGHAPNPKLDSQSHRPAEQDLGATEPARSLRKALPFFC